MQEIEVPMMHCPSFSSYSSSSISFVEIAAKVIKEEEEFGFQTFSNEETKQTPLSEEEENGGHDEDDDTKQTPISEEEENDGDEDDDFEFAFVNCSDTNTSLSITADQIFCNGIIKPISPIFNQNIANFQNIEEEEEEEEEVVLLQEDKKKSQDTNEPNTNGHKIRKVSSCPRLPLGRLFLKEFSSSTSSSTSSLSDTDVDSASYCIWKPKTFTTSPEHTYSPNKKSKSIGNSNKPKGFTLRDLIRRSNSDINKTYVYLANHIAQAPLPSTNNKKSSNEKSLESMLRRNSVKGITKEDGKPMDRKLSMKKVSGGTAAGNVTAHEMHYLRNKAAKEGDKRRSFLPYKRDLIGFFGFNRKLYPFA